MEELMALLQGGGGMGAGGQPGGMEPEGGRPPALPSQAPGVPPQLAMILQALEGIGAQAAQSSGQDKMNQMASQQFVPPDTGMPMESPQKLPQDDKAMLDQVHAQMGEENAGDHAWQGEVDGTPTAADLKMIEEMPTDGVMQSFYEHFPTWVDQNMQSQGGKGMTTTGDDSEMMESEEDITSRYANRKTKIDER